MSGGSRGYRDPVPPTPTEMLVKQPWTQHQKKKALAWTILVIQVVGSSVFVVAGYHAANNAKESSPMALLWAVAVLGLGLEMFAVILWAVKTAVLE